MRKIFYTNKQTEFDESELLTGIDTKDFHLQKKKLEEANEKKIAISGYSAP